MSYNESKTIRVFHTHIEVSPYTQGDNKQIEKMFSKWDSVTHTYVRIAYYIEDNILYLPKGTSLALLTRLFNTTPLLMYKPDNGYYIKNSFDILFEPKNETQRDSIEFLTFTGKFIKGTQHSQFGLNLDTGAGKTFCMISAISKINLKTIIIVHKTRIKEQWISEFLSKTNISEDQIMTLEGSKDIEKVVTGKNEADIYITNHQTLAAYARLTSWKKLHEFFKIAEIGIKVFDEAHKFFQNILMIDFFSDTKLSYYLTATFSRSDPMEINIFNKSFSSLYRFGEETINYDENRKHIVFCAALYRSEPEYQTVGIITNGAYGFNSYRYIDYALKKDYNKSMMRVIKRIINQVESLEGKILITSPKIESIEIIAKEVQKITTKKVGIVHSKQSLEKNNLSINTCDIISSTIQGIGEGDDIKGLRVLINVDPIASKTLADQLRGRLREYSKDKDTYMFYLIDTGIPHTFTMFQKIKPVFQKKCKEIYISQFNDI